MFRVTESQTFPAPVSAVWQVVNDHDNRLAWDVMLRDLEVHTPGPTRVGTELTQRAKLRSGGATLRARYTDVRSPNESPDGTALLAIKMVKGPWYFRRFTAVNRMVPVEGGCRSEGVYEFEVRPRWLAWLVGPVVRAFFAKETRKRWRAWRAFVASARETAAAGSNRPRQSIVRA